MTFSIVAADPARSELGVAVASRFPAVGAVVPLVESGVGAAATQSFVWETYATEGIERMRAGEDPDAALAAIAATDAEATIRQAGLVSAAGIAASLTGASCLDWAGGIVLDGAAIQGNILTGPDVIDSMAAAWTGSAGLPLADRLIAALLAGDRAGGDRRGRQSAAMIVRGGGVGYGGSNAGSLIDLRVDDHPDPVPELVRLLGVYRLVFETTPEEEWILIDAAKATAIRKALAATGVNVAATGGWDDELERALLDWVVMENLDERWPGGDRIDPVVVRHLIGS